MRVIFCCCCFAGFRFAAIALTLDLTLISNFCVVERCRFYFTQIYVIYLCSTDGYTHSCKNAFCFFYPTLKFEKCKSPPMVLFWMSSFVCLFIFFSLVTIYHPGVNFDVFGCFVLRYVAVFVRACSLVFSLPNLMVRCCNLIGKLLKILSYIGKYINFIWRWFILHFKPKQKK